MSIEAMKWAIEVFLDRYSTADQVADVIGALRQAIEQAEKREWVGLTDEEIFTLSDEHLIAVQEYIGCGEFVSSIDGEIEFAKAIEAKLKEKNT